VRNSGALILWNGGQHFIGRLEVLSHHSRLILQDRQQEREAHDVELLVAQVEAVVVGDVAEQIHLSV